MFKQFSLAVVASALMTGVTAQTTSSCNPLEKTTCEADTALSKTTYSHDFTTGEDSSTWSSVGAGDVSYTSNGAEFTINKKGNAPTLQSEWYIFFGRLEVHMKAAPGTGIVSSVVLLSDDLDEIDWEFLGGENDYVQTNYFIKGDSSSTAGESKTDVSDTQGTSHNYTIDWTQESLTWYIDGKSIRTLAYSDDDYPQTPMHVRLGIWAGGDSDNAEGTITWAGGETDYSGVPFTMTVESIEVTNYNPGKSYTYTDQTGSYSSIEVNDATSDDDDDSSSTTSKSSSKTSSKTSTKSIETKTKTSSTETETGSATNSVTATDSSSATATDDSNTESTASALADSTTGSSSDDSSDSSSTPTSSSGSSSSTAEASLGFSISPSVWMAVGAAAAVLLGQF